MSRQHQYLPSHVDAQGQVIPSPIMIVKGSDHAVGRFIQVMDKRYAGTQEDEQGEGYVFDYDDLFKCSTNLLGIDTSNVNKMLEILEDEKKLRELCDAHLVKLGIKF